MSLKRTLQFGCALASALVCASAPAKPSGLSSDRACLRLKIRVAQLLSAPHGVGEYRCELTKEGADGVGRSYYVFGLYSYYPAPPGSDPDWIGSSIVGWYAVSRATGQLYRWDVGAENIQGKL